MIRTKSDPFPILSGVPQGCPASPIICILVAEALARAVKSDPHLKGIEIDGVEYKLTQFADDTQLLLRSYKYLRRMWVVLSEYEDATGKRSKLQGDVSKIGQIIGLTAAEKALIANLHFMSGRLAGTR